MTASASDRDHAAPAQTVSLRRFNRMDPDDAADVVRSCLAVDRWVAQIVGGRPYQ